MPELTALAKPELLIVATVAMDEVQVTCVVRLIVLPSLNVPVAVNCFVPPMGTVGLAGVMFIDVIVALDTVSVVGGVLTTLANTAVMDVVPGVTPVARPNCPEVLPMEATEGWLEAQVTLVVRFCVLWSAKVPVALNCTATPSGTSAGDGVTAMETSGDEVTTNPAELLVMP